MRYRTLVAIAAAASASAAIFPAMSRPEDVNEQHKKTVIAFYNAVTHGDIATIRKLGDPNYVQHDPDYPDKLAGLISVVQSRPAKPNDPPLSFVRVIAGENYVVTVRRRAPRPAEGVGDDLAMIDIFQVNQGGKVSAHWRYAELLPRAGAPVPPLNSNGYF